MKHFTTLLLTLVLLVHFSSPALYGQDTDPSKWTVEDVIKQDDAYGLEFSPDGNSVVWIKRRTSLLATST